MNTQPDWETLNAYVDGELRARDAAAVAEAAGRETTVAEQIACLYKLKGVASAAAPDAPADLRGLMPALPPRRRGAMAVAMAAVAAFAVAVVVFWPPPVHRPQPALPAEILDTARALHKSWLVADRAERSQVAPAIVLAALSQFRELPVIPDLQSAQLFIERVAVDERARGHVLQVGYRGNHGCHLSLFVFTSGNLPDRLVRQDSGAERVYGWQVDELGYLLLAEGMDAARFDLIAEMVEKATHTRTPFDNRTRQALADSKAQSASCAA